jgi:O-antigen ligase
MRKTNLIPEYGIPWHAWGCMAIAFLIPTFKRYVPGYIALLAIYCIAFAIRKRKIYFTQTHPTMLLMAAMFLTLVAGIAATSHPDVAQMETEIKLSFIAFPIISWLLPVISRKNAERIFNAFVAGCLVFMLAAIGYGVYRTIQHQSFAYLSYEQLSINYHPTYAAAYQSLSLFILLLRAQRQKWILSNSKLHYSAILITAFFISLLASKAGILSAALVIGYALIIGIKKTQNRSTVIFQCLLSAGILFGSMYLLPASAARVEAMVNDLDTKTPTITNEKTEAKSSTELRKITWSAAFEVMRKNPLGAGTGNTQFLLNEIYEREGEQYAAQRNLNTHNQFLQTGAEHGWPGFFILLALILSQLVGVLRLQHNIIFCVIALCAFNFLFESFLEVQAGIVFYCFWSMVFARSQRPIEQNHLTAAN